ncbi:MAG TPA: PEP-CTERM sorting domain-containing protein [Isosphaeraceae bacterium]|jgi:hypothetical protein
MTKPLGVGLASLILLLGARPGHAELIALLTSPDNLSNLAPGQTVTVNVELAGLEAGETLDSLGATIVYPASQFGEPTALTAGSIVPEASGFLGAGGPGLADAVYDALFATNRTPISSNGVFFTFDVIAQAAGAGQFVIDVATAQQGEDAVPIASGPGLGFQVQAIPEPSALLLGGIGVATLALYGGRRRRRAG